MTHYLVQKRQKNDILHAYPYDDDPSRAACGSRLFLMDYRDSYELRDGDLEEGYVIRDGAVIGKLCSNCANVATGDIF